MSEREMKCSLRRELAFWQRGAAILAAVLVILVLTAISIIDQRNDRENALRAEIAKLEKRNEAIQEIETAAVTSLGSLAREFEEYRAQVARDRALEEAERAQAMAAYEEMGAYQYIGVCTLTAYCCESKDDPHICGDGDGLTATGLPVAPGMVAVDPDIIPLGSTVIINGVSYLAADTGVSGYHIDIAIQTHEEASDFGVSSAEVWIIPPGGAEHGN